MPQKRFFLCLTTFAAIFGYDAPADIPKFFTPAPDSSANQALPPSKPERFMTSADTYLYVDALFVKPRLVGLAFAVEAVDPVYDISDNNPAPNDPIRTVYYPNFQNSFGYKVGAGVFLEADGLELRISFMGLEEKTHCNKVEDFHGYGFGTWDPLPLQCSWSDFTLHFYRANFDLVYSFFANPYINIDTFFGVIASWQKQYFNIHYTYATQGWPITDNLGASNNYPWLSSDIHNRCNYSGYGARAGLSGQFYFTPQLSIKGDFALGLPWSIYGVKTSQTRTDTTNTPIMRYNFDQCVNAISPVLDLGLSLAADRWFRQRSCNAAFMIGIEEQIWFSQNRFETPTNLFNGKGALFLSGAFIKLQITL
jgi:hypothetical protein